MCPNNSAFYSSCLSLSAGVSPGIQPDDHLSWSGGVSPANQPSSHFSWRRAPASNHHHNSSWPSLFSVWSACPCLSVMCVCGRCLCSDLACSPSMGKTRGTNIERRKCQITFGSDFSGLDTGFIVAKKAPCQGWPPRRERLQLRLCIGLREAHGADLSSKGAL